MKNKQLAILTLIWFRSCSASCRNCSSSLIFSLYFSHSTDEENLPIRGKKSKFHYHFLLFKKEKEKTPRTYIYLLRLSKGFWIDIPFSTPSNKFGKTQVIPIPELPWKAELNEVYFEYRSDCQQNHPLYFKTRYQMHL